MTYQISKRDPTTLRHEEWSQVDGLLPNKWIGHRGSTKLPLRPSDLRYRNFFFYGFFRDKGHVSLLPMTSETLKV